MEDVKEGNFTPNIVMRGKEPVEYSAFLLKQYADLRQFPTIPSHRCLNSSMRQKMFTLTCGKNPQIYEGS